MDLIPSLLIIFDLTTMMRLRICQHPLVLLALCLFVVSLLSQQSTLVVARRSGGKNGAHHAHYTHNVFGVHPTRIPAGARPASRKLGSSLKIDSNVSSVKDKTCADKKHFLSTILSSIRSAFQLLLKKLKSFRKRLRFFFSSRRGIQWQSLKGLPEDSKSTAHFGSTGTGVCSYYSTPGIQCANDWRVYGRAGCCRRGDWQKY